MDGRNEAKGRRQPLKRPLEGREAVVQLTHQLGHHGLDGRARFVDSGMQEVKAPAVQCPSLRRQNREQTKHDQALLKTLANGYRTEDDDWMIEDFFEYYWFNNRLAAVKTEADKRFMSELPQGVQN